MITAGSANPLLLGPEGYQIGRSVRLRSSASAYFNRTFGTPTNNLIFTWSGWRKRGTLGVQNIVLSGGDGTGANGAYLQFQATDKLQYTQNTATATSLNIVTTQVFRDPSAWYHLVLAVDTTQATAANRIKIYINGALVSALDAASYPAQNLANQINVASRPHYLGRLDYASLWFDGYLTEDNFIDGQALTPSSFGETNPVTGVWQPKKYGGTYGTNGFYLNFSDPSAATAAAIGKDYSGNGNNWTPNNISVTAGVTYDSMLDVPTPWADGGNGRGNYAVLNPLVTGGGTISQANIAWTGAAGSTFAHSGFGLSSGKWYCEMSVAAVGTSIGLAIYSASAIGINNGIKSRGYLSSGVKYSNGTTTAYGATFTTNDTVGMAVDVDAGTVEFFKNNTSQGVAYSDIAADTWFVTVQGGGSPAAYLNFGQRPFTYTPPTGFKALNTQNLPDSTVVKGNKYFDALLWTGDGATTRSISGLSFQPDLVWSKSRSAAYDNGLYDSVRGAGSGKVLVSNSTGQEGGAVGSQDSVYGYLTSFDASGFSVAKGSSATQAFFNDSTKTYVGWQWKKGATQGFDIVTYTGTGAARTVAHNLGAKPAMIIPKSRSNATNWESYHSALGATKYIALNLTNAAATASTPFNNTEPTASVFTVGTSDGTNFSGYTYVAYLFAEVAGFSKFGSYVGNGSTDGPFVYCGFRPRYVLVKRTDTTGDWQILDTSRSQYNPADARLWADLSLAEVSNTGGYTDFVSNGFKLRNSTNADDNASGGTYIFAAFAENPFKNSLAR